MLEYYIIIEKTIAGSSAATTRMSKEGEEHVRNRNNLCHIPAVSSNGNSPVRRHLLHTQDRVSNRRVFCCRAQRCGNGRCSLCKRGDLRKHGRGRSGNRRSRNHYRNHSGDMHHGRMVQADGVAQVRSQQEIRGSLPLRGAGLIRSAERLHVTEPCRTRGSFCMREDFRLPVPLRYGSSLCLRHTSAGTRILRTRLSCRGCHPGTYRQIP